jgi:Kdo2-lipid IVA lauroyltransferase/acyltransferase
MRHRIGRRLGTLAYKYNHKRRQVAVTNLRLCFPNYAEEQIQDIIRENFYFAATAFIEYGMLAFASFKRLDKIVEYQDFLDCCRRYQGQGVVFLTAHAAFIDFCGPGFRFHKPGALYKNFKNPVVDYIIARSRCRFAEFLISRNDSLKALIRHLKNGGFAVYLPDEDMGAQHSVFAPFFGVPKATLTATSRICRASGAVAIPVMTVWDQKLGKYRMTVAEPLINFPSSPDADARQLNQALEGLVRPYLSQYMWTLKLFRTRPEGENAVY